jgi:hypothetical protein
LQTQVIRSRAFSMILGSINKSLGLLQTLKVEVSVCSSCENINWFIFQGRFYILKNELKSI